MKIAVAAFLNALIIFASTGWAAEPAGPSKEQTSLQFRRVYVPESVEDWPKGDVKYLPMDAKEFERLVSQVQRKSTRLPSQSAAGFIQSQFECRLSGDPQAGAPLLQGSGTLDVSPAIASGVLMTLEPCNLAIDRAQWITSDGAPAVVGSSSDGHLQVLGERAGQMRFDWSLAGSRDSTDATVFVIQLPPCPVNRMQIDLPAELLPAADHGVFADEGPIEPGIHRWTLELGGWSACRLRLAKQGGDVQSRRAGILADQSTAYDVSLRGLEVIVDLNVGAHRGIVRKLSLNLDPSLELLEVAAGGRSLPWTPLPSQGGKWRRISVELPVALQDGPVKLRFRAVAPLTVSESWKLPRLQVQEAICRTNTVHLAVSSPLCVASLTPHGCRQTAASALKSVTGEKFDFEINDPDAEVEIFLARRAADVRATCATATFLGQGKMSSRVAADFHAAEGPVFSLDAAVLPNWEIDSVATQPTDALDDWAFDRDGSRRLAVRLARPLTPARPLRLIVSAQRIYSGAGRNVNVRLKMNDVVPLRFGAPIESRRLVDLRTGSANELRIAAGQSWRADVKELTPAELDLFADPPGDLLLHDNGGAANLRLVLTARKPSLSAEIRLEAVISRGILAENYTFSCTPAKTAPIERLAVHFAGHRDNPLSWSIDGLDETRLSARRWTAARVAAAGLTADEEVWEVVLGNRRSMPFELRATRKTMIAPGAAGLPLCLASLPDFAVQRASVLVRRLGPQEVQIVAHRANRLPVEAAPAGQIQTARAAYSYDPREEATPHPEPAIVVTCRDSANPNAWAWDCDVRSHYASDGAGDHLITYKIDNAGRQQVSLKLSPLERGDLREILINKKPATAFAADAASDRLTIDLPGDVKDIDLSLRISTSGSGVPLGMFQRLRPPLLDIGLPIFARHWSVELPPGYATLSAGDDSDAATASYSFSRRLLGLFGRGEEQRMFDPLRGSEWRELFRAARADDRGNGTSRATDTPGWSHYRTNLLDREAYVTVIRRSATDVAGCLLFLAVVALGTWPRTRRPLVLTMAAVVCGILALTLPAAVAGIFSGGLLGVAFCLLLALVRKPVAAEASRSRRAVTGELPSTLTNVIPYGAPVLAVALLCGGGPARAEGPRNAPAVQSILIPVNDKQGPTGGKYLVPESFFSELYRRTAKQVEAPQGWMIAQAAYRAALAEDVATRDYAVDQLTAEYEIHVFNAPARVRIPLHGDEVALVPDRARLDDRPVQPDWDADGSALLLDIPEPGEYRLELTLRPIAHPESHGGFELAIPRVPTARLEITVPSGGPPVAVPTARGAVRWEVIPSRWIAELGPADRLAVRWQDASAAADEPIDVKQLQWLKIEQGCVLLNVRLKTKIASPQPRRLQLKTDASLELLPDPTAAAQPTVTRGSDATQTIDCQLPASTAPSSASALDLHFLCTAASSVGVFRKPPIELVGSRPGRHWLAVSLDRSLDYGRASEAGAVQEFMRNWGLGESAPDLAIWLNGDSADWSMTTSLRKAETSSDQTVLWSFDSDEAQVRFDAQLTNVGIDVFQYRLAIPPALHVDSIAVSSEGKEVPSRWFENKDGHLTVFLGGAATGRQLLQLRGRLPIRQNRNFDLPQFRLEDVRIQDSRVRLYQSRRAGIEVHVSAATGLTEIKASEEGAAAAELGLPLRSFYVDPAKGDTLTVLIKALRLPPPPGAAAEIPNDAAPPQSAPPGAPGRVAAAKVQYIVQADGSRIGAAVLDVESPAAGDYPLIIPDGFQLLHLTVDGVPVDNAPELGQELSVPIQLHAARSRVEMLFVAKIVTPNETLTSKSRMSFAAPRLGDLPVKRTTWTIAAPRGLEPIPVEADGSSAGPDMTPSDVADGLAAEWRQFAANSGTAVSFTFDGLPNSITVGFRETDTRDWNWRVAAALLVATVLVVALVRKGLLVDWVQRWPNIAGIVLGIAWWLWAAPSALGLAIVTAILARQVLIRLRRSRAHWSGPVVPSPSASEPG